MFQMICLDLFCVIMSYRSEELSYKKASHSLGNLTVPKEWLVMGVCDKGLFLHQFHNPHEERCSYDGGDGFSYPVTA